MGVHLYRATVRGHFDQLADDVAARLRAEADGHDHLHAAFTPDGTFVYDARLVAFSLRYELRVDAEDRAAADDAATSTALDRAQAWLDGAGVGAKHLRVGVTNMAATWERASGNAPGPGRRARRR